MEFDAKDAETITASSVEERERLKTDPLYALEHFQEDKRVSLIFPFSLPIEIFSFPESQRIIRNPQRNS